MASGPPAPSRTHHCRRLATPGASRCWGPALLLLLDWPISITSPGFIHAVTRVSASFSKAEYWRISIWTSPVFCRRPVGERRGCGPRRGCRSLAEPEPRGAGPQGPCPDRPAQRFWQWLRDAQQGASLWDGHKTGRSCSVGRCRWLQNLQATRMRDRNQGGEI